MTAAALTDPAIAAADDIDTACVTVQSASGRIAVITNSRRASFGYDQRVEAHGSLGTLRTENVPQTDPLGRRAAHRVAPVEHAVDRRDTDLCRPRQIRNRRSRHGPSF